MKQSMLNVWAWSDVSHPACSVFTAVGLIFPVLFCFFKVAGFMCFYDWWVCGVCCWFCHVCSGVVALCCLFVNLSF